MSRTRSLRDVIGVEDDTPQPDQQATPELVTAATTAKARKTRARTPKDAPAGRATPAAKSAGAAAPAKRARTAKAEPAAKAGPAAKAVAAPAAKTTPRAPKPPVPETTVRMTVDLAASEHLALARACLDTAAEVRRPRLHAQQVARVLLRRFLADDVLRRKVIADIRAGGDKLRATEALDPR